MRRKTDEKESDEKESDEKAYGQQDVVRIHEGSAMAGVTLYQFCTTDFEFANQMQRATGASSAVNSAEDHTNILRPQPQS